MTSPTGTFSSYDAEGIREDLSDMIHDISPSETPFYTMCAKTKAKNTLHEWQTDALRSSGANKHVEGDDTAKRRFRVGCKGQVIGLADAVSDCHTAGVGVFDDHTGRLLEILDALERCIGIRYVVVGQCLAL